MGDGDAMFPRCPLPLALPPLPPPPREPLPPLAVAADDVEVWMDVAVVVPSLLLLAVVAVLFSVAASSPSSGALRLDLLRLHEKQKAKKGVKKKLAKDVATEEEKGET